MCGTKQYRQCLRIDTTTVLCAPLLLHARTCADEWPVLPKRHRFRRTVVQFVAIGGYDEYVARVSRVKVEEENAHGGPAKIRTKEQDVHQGLHHFTHQRPF